MRRRIPNTAALVAFEAAARHENLSVAAEELCLTESAVSRQITALEDYLGLKLFNRIKNRLSLSAAGRIYCEHVSSCLDQLEKHTLSLMAHQGQGGVLELAVIPTFTLKWLIPRLRSFYMQHPEILINMREKPEPFLFRNSNFDAAVHFDHPAWAGVIKLDLFGEELIPVLSPRHFDVAALRDPADLEDMPLLHKATAVRADAWKRWFALAGRKDSTSLRGPQYELYSMLIEAARAGLGAALVPRFYVTEELASGALAAPFPFGLKDEKRFCVVYPDYRQDYRPLAIFLEWIAEEARSFERSRGYGA
jgi:LysR family transcriptional regulator, glycine cleavage system transcriptional activator